MSVATCVPVVDGGSSDIETTGDVASSVPPSTVVSVAEPLVELTADVLAAASADAV